MNYKGYANYETWNVAHWIEADESLLVMARWYKGKTNPYLGFIEQIKFLGGEISTRTPDGVFWHDQLLDLIALNSLIHNLSVEVSDN